MDIGYYSRVVRCAIRLRPASLCSRPRLERILFAYILVAGLTWPHNATSRDAPVPAVRPRSGADTSGYLHTDGARLVDGAGQEVRITGINWFGLETCAFAPHGLWSRNWRSMMLQIKDLGFNTIRLPFSNQLFDQGSQPNGIDYGLNPDLKGLSGLRIMDKVVAEAQTLGLTVILDQHRPDCKAQSALWYTDSYSEARWIADWARLARRYAGNDAVIGADLHNEPHGAATWGDGNVATDWRLAAERAGNAILAVNPHWLIIVEGIEHIGSSDWYWWGGNLANAGRYPVRLAVPGRLVYEAHDYGPEVSQQSWFSAPDFPRNLAGLWDQHWGYLQEQGIAPVLVGEFGGKAVDSGVEGTWIHTLVDYIRAHGLSFTYWCLNPNSGDTGGILNDDWTTTNTAKMDLLRPILAPPPSRPMGIAPAQPARTPSTRAHVGYKASRSTHQRSRRAGSVRANHGRSSHQSHGRPSTQPGLTVSVKPSFINGISTGEDDLSLSLPATLYHLSVTIFVHRSAPGVDPGEANPQALAGAVLSARAVIEPSLLHYSFAYAVTPAGRAAMAARFDFTSARQNREDAHHYDRDSYIVRYATKPAGPLTTLTGQF